MSCLFTHVVLEEIPNPSPLPNAPNGERERTEFAARRSPILRKQRERVAAVDIPGPRLGQKSGVVGFDSAVVCGAIAAGRGATADTPALGSSRSRRGRGRSGSGGSRSAGTARQRHHSRQHRHIPHCLRRSVAERRTRHLHQRASPPLRQSLARRIRHLAPGGPARSPFLQRSPSSPRFRDRASNSFFSRAFSCSNCFSRRMSSGCSTPNRFFQV